MREQRGARWLALGVLVLCACVQSARAGTMSLSWESIPHPRVTGFRVHLGSAPGVYTRSIDVGLATSVTLTGLADCTNHFVAIKAASVTGESPQFSNEVWGWPRPRIEPGPPVLLVAGSSAEIVLRGANFHPAASVAFVEPGIAVQSVEVHDCNELVLQVTVAPGQSSTSASVKVVNPGGVFGTGYQSLTVIPGCANPDADHDGFSRVACGGPDCDDANPAIHPFAACDPLRIDFAPPSSAAALRHVKDDGTPFSAARGYGWSAVLNHRERVTAAPLALDTFVTTQAEAIWQCELPNGEYDVLVAVGDASFPSGPHRMTVGGLLAIPDVRTAPLEFITTTVPASVRNGRLQIAAGGSQGSTAIGLVEVREAATVRPPISVSFQPAGSTVPAGYLPDSGQVFDSARGYGWDAPLDHRDRGRDVPQVLDTFVFATSAVRRWEMALPNGFYEVLVSAGDASFAPGAQRIVVEGDALVSGESLAAGEFVERQTAVHIVDGRLTVEIGGTTGSTALNQVVAVEALPDLDHCVHGACLPAPVAYWSMDADSVDGALLRDRSGRGHDGTIAGAILVPGYLGESLRFTVGQEQHVVVPDSAELDLGARFTIAAWIYPETYGQTSSGAIVHKFFNVTADGYALQVGSQSNQATLRVFGVSGQGMLFSDPGVPTLREWQHVAVVLQDGFLDFYRNGQLVGRRSAPNAARAGTRDLYIGNDRLHTQDFNGRIDELRIYDVALTGDQLLRLMTAGGP